MPRSDVVAIWEGQNVVTSARLVLANGALLTQGIVPTVLLSVWDKATGIEVSVPMTSRRPGSASSTLTSPVVTPPVTTDLLTIGPVIYEVLAAGAFSSGGSQDVLLGETPFETYQHLKAAINGTRYKGRGSGELYGRAMQSPHPNIEAQLGIGDVETTLGVTLEFARYDDMGPSGDTLVTTIGQGGWSFPGVEIGDGTAGVDTITGLVVDGHWSLDSRGYNWQDKLPGDAILEQGGRVFRLEYEFTTTTEGPLYVISEVSTSARFGA